MPSADLLLYFKKDSRLWEQWWVTGTHYAKTCEVNNLFLFSCRHIVPTVNTGKQDWLAKTTVSKMEIKSTRRPCGTIGGRSCTLHAQNCLRMTAGICGVLLSIYGRSLTLLLRPRLSRPRK